MPFTKRSVGHVYIRRSGLDNAKNIQLGEEHEVIVNHSYSQILLQLSQLATHASEIFQDLSGECQAVIARSQNLKSRVWKVEQDVGKLSLLDTPIHESSLQDLANQIDSKTSMSCVTTAQECGLFTASSRPDCVQKLYDGADITPRAVYASLGQVGYKAAKNFCLTPVFTEPRPVKMESLQHMKSKGRTITYERDANLRNPRPRSHIPRPKSSAAILDYHVGGASSRLPTLEERVIKSCRSQPSVVVPIDTSMSAFDRFAATRASLKNLQKHKDHHEDAPEEIITTLSRTDARRRTISGPNDLRHTFYTCEALTTEHLLEPKPLSTSGPKNPDRYIDDRVVESKRDRSRSKDKRGSKIFRKIVKRSRSLPRNMGRTQDSIVAPDFYDIHPSRTLSVERGALLTDKSETVYTNFYGAPNTELPSPQPFRKLKKSKSDHEISSHAVRSKSLPDGRHGDKTRPRSVSTERHLSVTTADDRKYSSLSRTFTGLFRVKKPKASETSQVRSADSLSAQPESRRNTLSVSHVSLRKRDSKATTSSGRWSGSERFSMDSDGIFSATSQNRLSRLSADRDSALGAEISESRTNSGESSPPDNKSMFSIDQDGFYTTMHRDSYLHDFDDRRATLSPDEAAFQSSNRTSTVTLSEELISQTYSDSNSFPEPEQTEEISKRVRSKVEAGKAINRYSLVAAISDEDLSIIGFDNSPPSPAPRMSIKHSKTYESELDLVLEDMSETATIHSDSESVLSLNVRQPSVRRKRNIRKQISTPVYAGCDKIKEDKEKEYARNCCSLPRDIKNSVKTATEISNEDLKEIIPHNGSWPRNLNKKSVELNEQSKSGATSANCKRDSLLAFKRRSLSPGKLNSIQPSAEDKQKIANLIIEARRMSAHNTTPPKSKNNTQKSQDLVSPYATSPFVSSDSFQRQPSYRMAMVEMPAVEVNESLPSQADEANPRKSRRNCSYRLANNRPTYRPPEQLPEGKVLESPSHHTKQTHATPLSNTGFDRGLRAPSYRKATSIIPDPHDANRPDSGCVLEGAHASTSGSSSMTSSYDSGHAETPAKSSYRLAVDDDYAPSDVEGGIQVTQTPVPKTAEIIKIKTKHDSSHIYAKPRIGPAKNSFHPHYVNITIDPASLDQSNVMATSCPTPEEPLDLRYTFSQSKPQTKRSESTSNIAYIPRASLSSRLSLTPPNSTSHKKLRPCSVYTPTDSDAAIPDNKLMTSARQASKQSVFTSMEMLKREEMAVMSLLGKIRQSTRPLSFVQTDI